MAGKLPSIQFYPGDWHRDAGVQSLTLEERGAWFEILLLMHDSERRGVLLLNGVKMPDETLAAILRCDVAKLLQIASKLLAVGVASIDPNSGALMNRRMCKDEDLRQTRAEAGALGGKQKAANRSSKRLAESTPSSSSSSSSSISSSKKKDSPEPEIPASGPPPPVLSFPIVGKGSKQWPLSQEKLDEYAQSYPALDVLQECRSARQWCIDNPSNRKTGGGMPGFLTRWLNKAQNAGSRNGHSKTQSRGGLGAIINRNQAQTALEYPEPVPLTLDRK